MQVSAFAKINLTLEVLGRRTDGYHEVMTILQTVDLADRLDIQPAPILRVQCDDSSLEGESNLVWQAAVKLAQLGNILPQAQILVRKRIPIGMGLGGGSSDAAAALLALNDLWQLGLNIGALAEVAAELGSDVPFFLWGGTALAQGRGEMVSPLPTLPKLPVTLVCPRDTIPDKTATLYSSLTSAHYSDGGVTRRMMEILTGGQFVVDMVNNVFEGVAAQAFPGLGAICHVIERVASSRPHLSGAGPALFCLPSNEDEHRRIVNALEPFEAEAYLVNTTGPNTNN